MVWTDYRWKTLVESHNEGVNYTAGKLKHFIKAKTDEISKNAQWHEKSIRYTGSVRCPDCGGPITQTRRIVPGNTKSVECKNCKKYRLIPRDKWESYSDAGQIMER